MRVLLHGTLYLTHAAGPDSRLWTASQIWLHLAAMCLVLAGVWWGLVTLGRRAQGMRYPWPWRSLAPEPD